MKTSSPWQALAAAALLCVVGCGLNKGAQDASSSDDDDDTSDGEDGGDDGEDGPDDLQEGCDWLKGSWIFRDCHDSEGYDVAFAAATGCTFTTAGENPLFVGATATTNDSGFSMSLPDGNTCSGYYDGKVLEGACSSGPCWFYATPD